MTTLVIYLDIDRHRFSIAIQYRVCVCVSIINKESEIETNDISPCKQVLQKSSSQYRVVEDIPEGSGSDSDSSDDDYMPETSSFESESDTEGPTENEAETDAEGASESEADHKRYACNGRGRGN